MTRLKLVFLLASALLCAPALAAVTCTASAQAVSFGNYDPASLTPTSANGQVTVSCTATLVNLFTNYDIGLSSGASGDVAARTMTKAGGGTLAYNLYKDPLYALVWGNTGTDRLSSGFLVLILGGASANHTVYGRIAARQNAGVGSYSDTITVTVSY